MNWTWCKQGAQLCRVAQNKIKVVSRLYFSPKMSNRVIGIIAISVLDNVNYSQIFIAADT